MGIKFELVGISDFNNARIKVLTCESMKVEKRLSFLSPRSQQ